jgi:hypothetical protein
LNPSQSLQVKNPMTMTEKILANHSDNKLVRAAAAAAPLDSSTS